MSQKTSVDISICKSNIKEETYYARVCSTGYVSCEELLAKLKKVAPYADENLMAASLKELGNIILELVKEGKTVEFFSLGCFSLGSRGCVEVEKGQSSYLQDKSVEPSHLPASRIDSITAGSYDLNVSPILKSKPAFCLNFQQSLKLKKALQNVEVNVAIKKKRLPTITEVTHLSKIHSTSHMSTTPSSIPTILSIKGEDLKIVQKTREDTKQKKQTNQTEKMRTERVNIYEQVGVYIEEKESEGSRKASTIQKIPMQNIIKNTPKELVVILDEPLIEGKKYNLAIATQYVKMGKQRIGQLLRTSKIELSISESTAKKTAKKEHVKLQKTLMSLEKAHTQRQHLLNEHTTMPALKYAHLARHQSGSL